MNEPNAKGMTGLVIGAECLTRADGSVVFILTSKADDDTPMHPALRDAIATALRDALAEMLVIACDGRIVGEVPHPVPKHVH